jgi:hypothetical protein
MELKERLDLREVFLEQLRRSFSSSTLPAYHLPEEEQARGREIHLSDLLKPRQSFWGRALPIMATQDEALLFAWGRGFELDMARRTQLVPGRREHPHGISCRPDFTEWPGHWSGVIEMKARRANLATIEEMPEKYDNYLEQMQSYCALKDGWKRALLIVGTPRSGQRGDDPLAHTKPDVQIVEASWTDAELLVQRRLLIERRDALSAALLSGRYQGLPLCPPWMCGKRVKTTLEKPRCHTCNKTFETQWGIDKHTASKSGSGHDVQNERASWAYEPRCKWYDHCAPQLTDPSRGTGA